MKIVHALFVPAFGCLMTLGFVPFDSGLPPGSRRVGDAGATLVRGADEQYASRTNTVCDDGAVQAAHGGIIPQYKCDYINSSPPINTACGVCYLPQKGGVGSGLSNVKMGSGVFQTAWNCGVAYRGTCTIVYGPPATYKCLSLSPIRNDDGDPLLCTAIPALEEQPIPSGGN